MKLDIETELPSRIATYRDSVFIKKSAALFGELVGITTCQKLLLKLWVLIFSHDRERDRKTDSQADRPKMLLKNVIFGR